MSLHIEPTVFCSACGNDLNDLLGASCLCDKPKLSSLMIKSSQFNGSLVYPPNWIEVSGDKLDLLMEKEIGRFVRSEVE